MGFKAYCIMLNFIHLMFISLSSTEEEFNNNYRKKELIQYA